MKHITDFHIWKSSVLLNDDQRPVELIEELSTGRYLIETKDRSYIYLWIMTENLTFKLLSNFFLVDKIKINLSFERNNFDCKKVLYKYRENEKLFACDLKDELKQLNNDFYINSYQVSKQYFADLIKLLNDSNQKLPLSLQKSNEFNFALI